MATSPLTHQPMLKEAEAEKPESRRIHSQVGFLFATVFLTAQFFSLTRNFFALYLGDGINGFATIANFSSIVLLPVILLDYHAVSWSEAGKGRLSRSAQLWVLLLLISVIVLTVYGVVRGYGTDAILEDLGVYLIFITFVILGSVREFWQDIFPVLLVLTVLGFVVNLVGLQNLDQLIQEDVTDRIARDLLAYKSRAAIDMWPLLLLTIHSWKKRGAILAIFAIAFFALILQILFQKRLPIAEVGLFYGVFFFIMARMESQWRIGGQASLVKGARSNFLILAAVMGVIALLYSRTAIEGQLTGLLNRYGREDDSRIGEAIGMITGLQDGELFFGRGMGGYFEYTDDTGYTWGGYIESAGVIGKTTVHIGFLMPMIKGGLYLMVVFYGGLVLVARRAHLYKNDYITFAAFAYLVIKFLVFLQGGFLIMSSIFDVILVGLCMGHILSKNSTDLASSNIERLPK